MTDYCKIGPLSITTPNLRMESDKYGTDEAETFVIHLTKYQARCIIAMKGETSRSTAYGVTIINNTNPWNPVYIDTSNVLVDNDDLKHKGWYIIENVEILSEFLNEVNIRVTAHKISDQHNELLTIHYTKGVNDGTRRDNSYTGTAAVYELNDNFSTFDTVTNWNTASNDGLTSPSITSDGTDLILSGASTANGTWKKVWTQSKQSYDAPFRSDFDFKWVSYSNSNTYPHCVRVFFTPNTYTSAGERNGLAIDMWSYSNYIQYQVYQVNTSGVWSKLINGTTTTATTHSWEVIINANKTATLKLGGLTKWSGLLNITSVNDIKPVLVFYNKSTTNESMKIGGFSIYDNVTQSPVNIVPSFAGANNQTAPDFTRASEDGNIGCYANPTSNLLTWLTSGNEYDGTIKAYNTNYTDTTARQIIATDEILSPTKFYVQNGIVKLETTTTGIKYYYWNGSSYTLLNTFVIGTINLLKVLESTPYRFTFQANTTKWTIYHGKPFITVEHDYTDLDYTLKTCYYHDASTTTDPAADASITMAGQNYVNIWSKGTGTCASPNPADDIRLQIMKTTPTTIKSDSIPASNITGIGHYDNTVTSGYNYYTNLPLEWLFETKTWIGIEQI